MKRALVLVLFAVTSSSCGLFLDGIYLISGNKMTKDVEQRRPTGQEQTSPERRLMSASGHVHVACEEVTRGVDRVWSVHKTYEHQGGWYQVHFLPIFLEGIIGGALGIGFGVSCGNGTGDCNVLYATIPFAVDIAYSIVRLLTIDKPKLVDKALTTPHTDMHPTPSHTLITSCDPDLELIAQASTSGGPFRVPVDANGWLAPQDEFRLREFMQGYRDANVALWAGGRQLAPDQARCAFFVQNPPVPPDCQPQTPSR
jgi:hypothetical protein